MHKSLHLKNHPVAHQVPVVVKFPQMKQFIIKYKKPMMITPLLVVLQLIFQSIP